MPRLPFVVEPEPDDAIVEIIAPLAQVKAWAAATPPAARMEVQHRRLSALRQPEDGPVRDCDGFAVHRVKVVSATELTCTVCGDTNIDGKCWRCGKALDPADTPMIPTVSYLNPDEYELIMRNW